VYEFKDHKIKEYLGDIDYFLEQRNLENLREAEKKTVTANGSKSKTTSSKQEYENQKKQKSLTNKLSKTEAAIGKLENEIKDIDLSLALHYDKTIAQPHFFDKYQAKKEQLAKLFKDWETVSAQLEAYV
jgi:ATP-binding cassette subfamily F protein 3